MTSKLSYISSWQFVFWDNERYLVSLQPKYIDALHVYVLKHSLTPCKSNSEVFIFIQFAMNIFYKAIIEPPIFPSLPTSFRIVISFVSYSSSVQKQFLLASQWRNNKKNVNSRQFFGVCVTPGCVTIIQRAFYAKTSKMNCPFTSLGGFLFNCPS